MKPAQFKGKVIKIGYQTDIDHYLKKGDPNRPMGRYNRPGQDAFYAAQDLDAAITALRNYEADPNKEQVILTYHVHAENLFDIRDLSYAEATPFLDKWKPLAQAGKAPKNWGAADKIRDLGYHGMIDPSRGSPGSHHLVLFKWNQKDAPTLELTGTPQPYPARSK